MKHCGYFCKEAIVSQNQSREPKSVDTPQNSRTLLYAVWSLPVCLCTSVSAQVSIDYPRWAQASLQIHARTALLAAVVCQETFILSGNAGKCQGPCYLGPAMSRILFSVHM